MKTLDHQSVQATKLREQAQAALEIATQALLMERNVQGHWVGELSSSALSTATAVCALAVVERFSRNLDEGKRALIERGLEWLARNQNQDGGWGDTVRSLSNISTTALAWAAFGAVPGADLRYGSAISASQKWLQQAAGGPSRDSLALAIENRYGKDKTFSVPILMACVLGNRFEPGTLGWNRVKPLPFELAALPHQLYGAIRLPVVSYALPALIAIGQARQFHIPSRCPLFGPARKLTKNCTLRTLAEIQPSNGGFLEAVPLTSFVTMSLASMGQASHIVTQKGLRFLETSVRSDGSWPIDTNLATWLTTLSINALSAEVAKKEFSSNESKVLKQWLLNQQHTVEHPYTHARPGGWAWTDLPGGVPDADDTSGALLALAQLGPADEEAVRAARMGIRWLLQLQNRDGGIPTFCRGWGALPFDRSTPDLTAHAVRAWLQWLPHLDERNQKLVHKALSKAVTYLTRTQRQEGYWVPLWFGNQFGSDDENPTYGTTRVLIALAKLNGNGLSVSRDSVLRAVSWILSAQNKDGSWGGFVGSPPSVEETALALEALGDWLVELRREKSHRSSDVEAAIARGLQWIVPRVESGEWLQASPIGFYFAKLWYFERLYPIIFAVGALKKIVLILR